MPHTLTIHELTAQFAAQQLTAREATQACLDRIAELNGKVGALLTTADEHALSEADAIDKRRKAGEPLGAVAGLPVAVKDVLCTKDWTTTCASRMLESFVPPYDSTVVSKLRAADAVLIG